VTCLRCAGLAWGTVSCGFCGADPAYPRKPMTVVVSDRYPPPDERVISAVPAKPVEKDLRCQKVAS